jgi:hypothetical protein
MMCLLKLIDARYCLLNPLRDARLDCAFGQGRAQDDQVEREWYRPPLPAVIGKVRKVQAVLPDRLHDAAVLIA